MTHRNRSNLQFLGPVSLTKRLLQGSIVALILITVFLLSAGNPNPGWHKLWMVKPLLVVPAAGAFGGLIYYHMHHLRSGGGWKRLLGILISLVAYVFILWLGTVLGLNGTYWD